MGRNLVHDDTHADLFGGMIAAAETPQVVQKGLRRGKYRNTRAPARNPNLDVKPLTEVADVATRAAATEFQLCGDQIRSAARDQKTSVARQSVIWALLRCGRLLERNITADQKRTFSTSRTGCVFNRDHTTIMHLEKRFEAQLCEAARHDPLRTIAARILRATWKAAKEIRSG